MQVTITPVSSTEREAAFELSGDELQPHFDRAYDQFRPKAQLKGFRKGKVPIEMIKKLYGEAIEHDALDEIANELYRHAMEERNIRPIGTPSMVKMDFRRKEHFHFTVKYEVKPDITLADYRGIPVTKPLHTVTEAEVEDEVHHLQRTNSTTAEVESVSDSEHIVTCDVQELDDNGMPLIGKKTAGARFYLADPALAPEIRDALQAARKGETYRVRYEVHHEEHTHKHHLDLAVTAVQKVELPVLNEELVSKITGGKVTSPEDFRNNLQKELRVYWETQADSRVNDALANEVVRRHDFVPPESMVEAFLQSFIDEVKGRSRDRKLPPTFDQNKFREENRAYAVWQAKWMLLREAIAEKENLTVTDDDIATLAEREAARMGLEKERILEYYKRSGSATDRLLSEKVMEFLRSNARITETVMNETSV